MGPSILTLTEESSSSVVEWMELTRLANEKYLYLTTTGRRTGRPHTVELWFAVDRGTLYLSHEGTYTDWMKNILRNPRVAFTIRDFKGSGLARLVGQGDAFERGKSVLYRKYYGDAGQAVIDDWFSESTVIEITVAAD